MLNCARQKRKTIKAGLKFNDKISLSDVYMIIIDETNIHMRSKMYEETRGR